MFHRPPERRFCQNVKKLSRLMGPPPINKETSRHSGPFIWIFRVIYQQPTEFKWLFALNIKFFHMYKHILHTACGSACQGGHADHAGLPEDKRSHHQADWKAAVKVRHYPWCCRSFPYCSISTPPAPTWWLYFPLDLSLNPASRRPPPRVYVSSPAKRRETNRDRQRWRGVGWGWGRDGCYSRVLIVVYKKHVFASEALITAASQRHRVTNEERATTGSVPGPPAAVRGSKTWRRASSPRWDATTLHHARTRVFTHEQRQRTCLQQRSHVL